MTRRRQIVVADPFVDITHDRFEESFRPPRYHYAVRICPNLSTGAASRDARIPKACRGGSSCHASEGGRQAEVYADATTVWPLLIKGVLEELGRK